jgi:hypothetical protein
MTYRVWLDGTSREEGEDVTHRPPAEAATFVARQIWLSELETPEKPFRDDLEMRMFVENSRRQRWLVIVRPRACWEFNADIPVRVQALETKPIHKSEGHESYDCDDSVRAAYQARTGEEPTP